MIEFAFIALFFFAFFIVLGDLTNVCYRWMVLHHAANKAARASRLVTDPVTIANQVESIAMALGVGLDAQSGEVNVTVTSSDITISIDKTITLSPLGGLLLQIAGSDQARDYEIRFDEVISNDVREIQV